METLIQGTISALGYLEDDVYYPEPDCFETIRDLIRFLRNDSADLLARRLCGGRNIVANDLLPILRQSDKNEKMFDITLRLLVNLVQPPIVSLMDRKPEDKQQWQTYWELEENLRRAKLAFADVNLFKMLSIKMRAYFLEKEWDERHEDDRLIMERIIVLIRYVFSISASSREDKRTALENNSHDRVIVSFLESGIDEVLIHIACQSQERDFQLSILEIIAYVVKEHNPADLVAAVMGRSEEEKRKAEEGLREALEKEAAKSATQKRQILTNRHSRFAGSYVVKGVQAINKDNSMVVHKAVKDLSSLTFQDERKKKKREAVTRRAFEAESKTHMSSMDCRIKLKEFCEKILEKAFNKLMKNTKEQAFGARKSVAQKNADIHYFLVMRFFIEFSRLAKFSPSTYSSCLGVEAFHQVQVQLDNNMEMATTQGKGEGKAFGIRAQYALASYKELILVHQYLLERGAEDDKRQAKATCHHILNVEEYRELGCNIIRKFSPGLYSKTFLRELVLTTHHYFRLLERSVKAGELTTVTKRQKKRRIGKKKKNEKSGKTIRDNTEKPSISPMDSLSQDDLDDHWCEVSEELSDVIMGHLTATSDQIPINSLLNVDDEQHQQFAMLYIQRALREGRADDAVGLYRSSRDIWPEDDIFGGRTISPEEEFIELREIFFVDLSEFSPILLAAEEAVDKKFQANELDLFDDGAGGEYSNSEDEDDHDSYESKEVEFNFSEYVIKYARSDVLKWYVFLLADFQNNSIELNKALVKMLHRVTFDLDMPSRMYQLSLFRIFDRVNSLLKGLSKESLKKNPLFELHTFGFHLLKKFLSHFAQLGDAMAPEVLFWKGARECFEVENGYGSFEKNREKDEHGKLTWTEELEDEVRSLYNEYRDMEERSSMDVLDFIEHNMTRPRNRKQINKKLKELGLDNMGAKPNKRSVADRTFPLIELKAIIEQHSALEGDKPDMVDYIKESLDSSGKGEFTRQKIIKQLTYLGVEYSKKPKRVAKGKWTDELITELSNLRKQYEEDLEDGDRELVTLGNYVMRRLSATKSLRQVEDKLREMGADIPVRPVKPRSTGNNKKKKDDFVANDSDGDDLNNEKSDGSQSSGDDISPNVSEDEDDEAKKGTSKSSKAYDSDASDGDMQPMKKPKKTVKKPAVSYDSDAEEGDLQPVKKTVTKKKKKAVIALTDEESDNDVVPPVNEAVPIVSKEGGPKLGDLKRIKDAWMKKRLAFSDDEHDTSDSEPDIVTKKVNRNDDAASAQVQNQRSSPIIILPENSVSQRSNPETSTVDDEGLLLSNKKRKRVIDSDDEDEDAVQNSSKSSNSVLSARRSESPLATTLVSKPKRSRLIVSDSEEDN